MCTSSRKIVCPGSPDFPAIVEVEMGRVVVMYSQRTGTLCIEMWDFFSLLQGFALFYVMKSVMNTGTI